MQALHAVGMMRTEPYAVDLQLGRTDVVDLEKAHYFTRGGCGGGGEEKRWAYAAPPDGPAAFVILSGRSGRKVTELTGSLIALQKREPERIVLKPYTSLELAHITLQKVR